jgi:hypothetical protein
VGQEHFVTRSLLWALLLASTGLAGCVDMASPETASPVPVTVNTIVPSATGTPIYVTASWPYEFVSVQTTGQIFTYNVSTGSQVLATAPYATPCADPSGMVITAIGSSTVMAVVCYDTGALLTLQVHADGSLSALGQVSGLSAPFPQIALDGTNVLIPLFGGNGVNGGVAKVSIATPSAPAITGTVTLASPFAGALVNTGYVAAAAGYIYVSAGSESSPITASSTIQVVNEATMTLVGSPLVVTHSPQQIVLQGNVAYATFYDSRELESIDISNPASLQPLETLFTTTPTSGCSGLPIVVQGTNAFVGCAEGYVETYDISNPSAMTLTGSLVLTYAPQRLALARSYLLVASGVAGGTIYEVWPGPPF